MTLDLRDCSFVGSALPEPFVRFDLHTHLARLGLLHHVEGKSFERNWDARSPTARQRRWCPAHLQPCHRAARRTPAFRSPDPPG